GGDIALPRENLQRLAASGAVVTARVPVVPNFNAHPDELDAIAAFVAGLGSIRRLHFIPYHSLGEGKHRLLDRSYPLAGIRSLSPEELAETAETLSRKYSLEVRIGG
ncbi:MAG: glycyl-radical enzyme activating protein, partial [Planctomycetes bacterium]|nr:glycyl-radical enzyme activating protein [Planctomycetota bacterium]